MENVGVVIVFKIVKIVSSISTNGVEIFNNPSFNLIRVTTLLPEE